MTSQVVATFFMSLAIAVSSLANEDADFDRCLESLAFQPPILDRWEASFSDSSRFSDSNKELFNRAMTSIDAGDVEYARASVERLEKRKLNDFELGLVYYLHGRIATEQENYEDALEHYERISNLDQSRLPLFLERETDVAALQLRIKVSSDQELVAAALAWCAKPITEKALAKSLLINIYGQLGREEELKALNDVVLSGEYSPIVRVAPVYPEYALRRGISGVCVVEFVVTDTGDVRNAKVVEGMCEHADVFEQPSIDAANQFKYAPRIVNGKAVEVSGVQNKFTYSLK
jgi:TonB family protein